MLPHLPRVISTIDAPLRLDATCITEITLGKRVNVPQLYPNLAVDTDENSLPWEIPIILPGPVCIVWITQGKRIHAQVNDGQICEMLTRLPRVTSTRPR
ncbi:hypothetical protein Y032_0042g535 [Ancylostoma ceylanicum]|uniref:Uncharacterized protein n=1 Tax=Ancylostoma ceylanicum TaxID=53326 RepID=A0A016UG07_9BILA|nr:hypothetical protein Y032_0042g535 [Ancylostoma ceylanicum]